MLRELTWRLSWKGIILTLDHERGIEMIGTEFITTALQQATYKLKVGTKGSYYWYSGTNILPNRLSINKDEMTRVARKGRNLLHPSAGQMVGRFKVREHSPLKRFKPFDCRTQIWSVDEYPLFIGYGTIGITNNEGCIADTADLVIFYTPDNWGTIQISFFRGLGKPDYLQPCMEYLNECITKNG